MPLVLWGLGIEPGRDSRAAGHVDLLPTILDALGLAGSVPADLPGRSLLVPEADLPPLYFEALSANLNHGWAPLRGLLWGGKKLIELPIAELYDLDLDPREEVNRHRSERELARELRSALPVESSWPPRRSADDEEQARLRSLGYLASSAPAKDHYGAEDDPKNLVDLDRRLHQVVELYTARRLEPALQQAREVVEERPSMAVGHSLLAQILLETGALGEAIAVMERARALGTASDGLTRQLALSLVEAGRAPEAVELLEPKARLTDRRVDPAVLTTLGIALSAIGRQSEARLVLERAGGLDPEDPKTLESLGMVALRQERWEEAETWLRQALELNPGSPEAWNMLAVARFSGAGDEPGALEAWGRSLELDGEQWDVLYNLGTVAPGLGRPDLARSALERFVAGAPRQRYARDLDQARRLQRRLPENG